MFQTIQTTDGRYNWVGENEWWDTTGVDTVPQEVVDRHLTENPRVGIVVSTSPE